MEREYAIIQVADGQARIVEKTPGFDPENTEKNVLPGARQVWISGDGLKKENEALRQRLMAAEEENRAKEAFLSSMNHDIRTPMNAVVGMSIVKKLIEAMDEEIHIQSAPGQGTEVAESIPLGYEFPRGVLRPRTEARGSRKGKRRIGRERPRPEGGALETAGRKYVFSNGGMRT